MDVVIKEWTMDDLPDVQKMTLTTWLATYGSFIPESDLRAYFDVHYNLEAMTALVKSGSVDGFIARRGLDPVGYVKTNDNAKEGRFYVTSLYILPEFQGLGVGSRLLAAAESCAVARGKDRVWLGVMVQNAESLRWYEKQGFIFVEEAPFTMGKTTVLHRIGYRLVGRQSEHY